jgi:hypothetical protein
MDHVDGHPRLAAEHTAALAEFEAVAATLEAEDKRARLDRKAPTL